MSGKVVYEVKEILEVWRLHFDALSTPKESPRFDDAHFQQVSASIVEWLHGDDDSQFLTRLVNEPEIRDAIRKLNLGKSPGYDRVTAEHLRFAGDVLASTLCPLFNLCIRCEYVPENFRRGIQVPLYKGKNTCSLSPDNYRALTLLSTFNKLFEVIIWGRVEKWWVDQRIVSDRQGAGRKASSCIHTALTLQETRRGRAKRTSS